MEKTILFSPVGLTDPMSNGKEVYDGALLHIYRHYRPDYTYLYLTSDMWGIEYHKNDDGAYDDHRYTKALECLSDYLVQTGFLKKENGFKQNHTLFKSGVKSASVYKMDAFYKDYLRMFKRIKEQQNTKGNSISKIIINISSGTPAMKAALYVLKSMIEMEYPCELVQVTDPQPRSFMYPGAYDVQRCFQNNVDNEKGARNRTEIAKCDNLVVLKMREVMKTLVDRYDYGGASTILSSLNSGGIDPKTRKTLTEFLGVAENRIRLSLNEENLRWLHALNSGIDTSEQFFRYSKTVGANDNILLCNECLLRLELYCKKKEYVEMVRAMTPLNTELLCVLFEKLTNKNIRQLVDGVGRFKSQLTNQEKKEFSGLALVWEKRFSRNVLSPGRVAFAIGKEEPSIIGSPAYTLMLEISKIEHNIRDQVAHMMIPLSENDFRKQTVFTEAQNYEVYGRKTGSSLSRKGFTPDDVMLMERNLIGLADLKVRGMASSYDRMNACVKELINQL